MPVKITMSKKLKDLLKGKIIKEAQKASFLEPLGKEAIDIIYKRTKAGKGVDGFTANASTQKLKPLTDKYVKWRKKNKPSGEFGTPKKSNLTYTGQLLKSMFAKITKGNIMLYLKGKHDSDLSNKKLGEYVQEKRPFFALAKKEQKVLYKKYQELIRLLVRRFNR